MNNIILVLLRHGKGYRKSQVAVKIGITYGEYIAIENGEQLMTFEIAQKLSELYGIKSKYFYEAASQLDLLITRGEVIKLQNSRMQELLNDGSELLHSSTQKSPSHENFTDRRPAID